MVCFAELHRAQYIPEEPKIDPSMCKGLCEQVENEHIRQTQTNCLVCVRILPSDPT